MNDFKLKNIQIGFADGAKEAEKDNFFDFFYTENNKYNELLQKYKFIISGRKGTGKTILAKYYQKKNTNPLTIIDYKKLNDLTLHYYIEMYSAKIDKDISKFFQEYYIYKQFVVTIIKNKRNREDFIKKAHNFKEKIKYFLAYYKYKSIYNDIENLYNQLYPDGAYKEKEIKEIQKYIECTGIGSESVITASINGTSEATQEIVKVRKNFTENIQKFKELVCSCLNYISVSIIIDDLDEIEMKDDADSLIEFLISLVTVVNEINMELDKYDTNSKCILLIRSDILSSFNSRNSNINKIITDCNVRLEWFKHSDELKKMILYKIKNSDKSGCLKNYDLDSIKQLLFSTSQDKTNNTFEKIMKYSFGRPRDIISFIDCIIRDNPNENQITFKAFNESEAEYSQTLFSEIQNEMSLHLSNDKIHDIEYLLRSFRKKVFSYDEIIEYYNTHKDQFPSINDIEETLQYLYQIGLIGNTEKKKNIRGRKNQYIYSFSYRNGGELLNKELSLVIHAGICKALNIV